MSIKVKDLLRINEIEDYNIIAGASGLDNIVERVSVIETPNVNRCLDLRKKGDFFITSFYAVKDNPDLQFNIIRNLINCDSSGLFVIRLYISDFPPNIIKLADENSFPIVFINKDSSYTDILTNTMEKIIQDKKNLINELRINTMLSNCSNNQQIISIAKNINECFKNNIMAMYYKVEDYIKVFSKLDLYKEEFIEYKSFSCMKYNRGMLIVLSFSKKDNHTIEYIVKKIIDIVNKDNINTIGISNLYYGLENIKNCIQESIVASGIGKIEHKNIVYYNDIGIYRLLVPLKDNDELKKFRDKLIKPIIKYDKENNTNLLDTAILFIENDGNVQITSKIMFQHENTIRYRVNKIKELIGMEKLTNEFFEQLSIAVKIHKLLELENLQK